MGTNYEYNADNFEEILSRLQNDDAGLASDANFVDSENGLGNFNFSDLEGFNLDDTNSRCNNSCPGNVDDINDGTLGIGNNNDCLCNTGVLNARECYERGLREGLERGFVRGLSRGRQQGRQEGLREGYNAGLERGLSRAEELARAAYQRGYRCGYERGFRAGYQKGFRDGCNAGFERGARAGFNNGFRRGYERALRDISRYINSLSGNTNNVSTANINGTANGTTNGNTNPCWRNLNNL